MHCAKYCVQMARVIVCSVQNIVPFSVSTVIVISPAIVMARDCDCVLNTVWLCALCKEL